MYCQIKYEVKIQPLSKKNIRKNLNAYYILLKSNKDPTKIFSKPILIDAQRQDNISSTNDITFDYIQLWNYDKMKLVQQQKAAFNISDSFTFTCKSEQIQYSVTKMQVAKSNKNIQNTKLQQTLSNLNTGRKNSEGEYTQIHKTSRKGYEVSSIQIQSEQESLSYKRGGLNQNNRIISAKQYHAY